MDEKLSFRYDREADILYIDRSFRYPEQDSEELGDEVVARRPETNEIENPGVFRRRRNPRRPERRHQDERAVRGEKICFHRTAVL